MHYKANVDLVLGAQWGDEGKGKIVDVLATEANLVCRCQVNTFVYLLIFAVIFAIFVYILCLHCLHIIKSVSGE